MSAGRASSRCDYHLLLEQGVRPVAVGPKMSRNRCPDGEHLPGEQALSQTQLNAPHGAIIRSIRPNGSICVSLTSNDRAALSIVTLGFFLGMRHATDADHVIAVSTIVSGYRSVKHAVRSKTAV